MSFLFNCVCLSLLSRIADEFNSSLSEAVASKKAEQVVLLQSQAQKN